MYVSGNDWPCLDPNKEKHEGSKTNLQFGREMSWLLGHKWKQQWTDRENTFCKFAHDEDIVEEEVEVNKHSLISFLQFTEVSLWFLFISEFRFLFRKHLLLVQSFVTVKLLMKQESTT